MTWRLFLGLTLAMCTFSLQAEPIDLQTAIIKAQCSNKPLKAAEAALQASLAEAWQLGLHPNPLLAFEMDDFGGFSYYKGFRHTDFSLSLTQLIELGGKRTARQDVALSQVCKSYWSRESLKNLLRRNLHGAFIEIVTLTEHIKILEEQKAIAQDALSCANEKSDAGKIPAYQQKRVAIAYHCSQMALDKGKTLLVEAIRSLSVYLGEVCPSFEIIQYPLFDITPPRPFCVYEENLNNNPELALARMEVYSTRQIYELERANRIPDMEVTASVNRDLEERDTCFSFGFAIPIPIFNRNEGNICSSSWRTIEADYIQQDIEIRLRNELTVAYQRLKQSYDAALTLQGNILKCAHDTLEATQEGYKQGKIELIDLLDAQKICNEIKSQQIEALKEYHLRQLEIETIAPFCGA